MNENNMIQILLAEDNPNDAELVLRAFKKHNLSNAIQWVKDGAEALDYIYARGAFSERDLNHRPKLVLLDLKMPRVSGLEVLKQLKSDDSTKMIPVVVLTSSAEEQDIVDSYQLGVNSYITKPVDFDKFVNSVAELGLYWLLINQPMP